MNHNKKVIPIALAADNNYAMPMAVTKTSILTNAKIDSFYDFYLLIPSDFSVENKEKLKKLQNKYLCKIK